MVAERGYRGAVRTLRKYVKEVRPRRQREVYLRTEPLPGEQAQVDWAYVAQGAGPRRRAGALAVRDRALATRARCGPSSSSTSRSTRCAARSCARPARSVASRASGCSIIPRPSCSSGSATRCGFTPSLLDLAAALMVQPRLCAVRRPEHKGKVERAIRYLRDRFLAGRTITSIADGNRALARFIAEIAHAAPAPGASAAHRRRRARRGAPSACCALPDPLPETGHLHAGQRRPPGVRSLRHQSLLGADPPRRVARSRSSSTT